VVIDSNTIGVPVRHPALLIMLPCRTKSLLQQLGCTVHHVRAAAGKGALSLTRQDLRSLSASRQTQTGNSTHLVGWMLSNLTLLPADPTTLRHGRIGVLQVMCSSHNLNCSINSHNHDCLINSEQWLTPGIILW
jgi:hypothetical protein